MYKKIKKVIYAVKSISKNEHGGITLTEVMVGIAFVGFLASLIYNIFENDMTTAASKVGSNVHSVLDGWGSSGS